MNPESTIRAKRTGLRHQITLPNGDTYSGEWLNDAMHGKGTYVSKKHSYNYEGDFKYGLRDGYGVYSVIEADGHLRKKYVGGWRGGLQHGNGTLFYDTTNTERYEGEWFEGQRSGWGRMTYADGSVYEGEFFNDQRCGRGLLLLPNSNRYEGHWENDVKHGEGYFFYLDKGQCYKGTWCNGSPKCGEFFDLDREGAPNATPYAIPALKLKDPRAVLREAQQASEREVA